MSKTIFVFLYVIIFFFSLFHLEAQTNKEEKQLLIPVLKQIELQYGVRFSYADANLKNKTIVIPSKNLSLSELLKYLEKQTKLVFKKLKNNAIAIRKLPSPKKTKIRTSKKRSRSRTNRFIPNRGRFRTQFLEEITISNYLTKGVFLENDGTITLKPNAFGILPGLIEADVLQTALALPGIQSMDERISNINIRGGTHDQNLILWDGIKMYQTGHFFGLISAFNPYLTKNVIISKNGTSAIYGDSVSCSIDMRSSNTLSEDFSAGIGLNLINVDAYAKIPLGKTTELQLSTRRSINDLFATSTYNQYFKRVFQNTELIDNQSDNDLISEGDRFYFYDVTARLLYNFSENDKLRFSILNVNNNLNHQEQSLVDTIVETLDSKLTQRNLATGIEYHREWNSQLSTFAQLYLSNYKLNATNYDILNSQRLIQKNEVLDNGLKLHFNYSIYSNLLWHTGYQFSEVGVNNLEDLNDPLFRSNIKKVLKTHALFNELRFKSDNEATNVRIGLRVNHIDEFSKTLIEPRVSINQRFSNNFRLEILGELKSQNASQIIDRQNDFLGIEKRRWVLANDSTIPIIKSKQISAGVHFNKNRLLISAEVYVKEVNGITTRSQGFQNQYQFLNATGGYQVKGFDFLINKRFNTISAWLSYSYSKNDYIFKDLNSGNPFPNNLDARHTFTFAGTYILDNFKFAIGLNWHTGKPFTSPNEDTPITNNFINYNAPNSLNSKEYLRADFSTTYTFNIGNTTNGIVGFSLWNVSNRVNIVNTFYTIDDTNYTVKKTEDKSLRMTPNFSFRLRF